MRKRVPVLLLLLCTSGILSCVSARESGSDSDDTVAKKPTSTKTDSSMSFVLLGDLHYDKLENHDMEWLSREKPGDVRQVTVTYVPNTELNWDGLMYNVRQVVRTEKPRVRGIVQIGDLSEGLAGSEELAVQMAHSAINAAKDTKMGVPWLLAKGNHDITGPGAKEAFVEVYTPFIREQSGDPTIQNATYAYRDGDVLFVFLDRWDSKVDITDFAQRTLSESDAKYKFVVMHEPVIPVTERCWHVFRNEDEKAEREAFMKVLAENGAIVLAAHLHRYAVVRRETGYGPIVQVMVGSVIGKERRGLPTYERTLRDYGPPLVDLVPSYKPDNAQERKAILSAEALHVTYYTMCDLAGYAVLKIDDKKNEVTLDYYAGFEQMPYDRVNLTKLCNQSN